MIVCFNVVNKGLKHREEYLTTRRIYTVLSSENNRHIREKETRLEYHDRN
jgi:hypothetical protein